MERIWIITAGFCAIIAIVLLVAGKFDGAFVAGAIGIVAWFLDVRSRLSRETRLVEDVSDPKGNCSGEQDED